MDLNKLRVPDLLLLLEELGGSAGQVKRKPKIIELIQGIGADNEELQECWEMIVQRKQDEEKAKQERAEREKREYHMTLKKIELERLKLEREGVSRPVSRNGERDQFKIKDLLQPYKIGEGIGLFLVNFERTCEKVGFEHVVARLTKEDAESYDKTKSALLKKFRLSTEAFRQRFRTSEKRAEQSYPEFAYSLKANLVEWLKSAEVHGNHDKVIECIALEQFYRCMPESARFWVQDRLSNMNVQEAAELAEEYATRRKLQDVRVSLPKALLQYLQDTQLSVTL
ncbi:uncharacterized protein LOC135389249 [Ornithodoros turicata]|uniref:uncharacterized protein LOC135389249 n=1 Tax=Ornithodoros turicata TaxID=34597 RepID=UPI00313A47E8